MGRKVVRLVALTHYGHTTVERHGSRWEVIQEQPSVPCLDNQAGLMLRSMRTRETRWFLCAGGRDIRVERDDAA